MEEKNVKFNDLTKEELVELIPEQMKIDEERKVMDFLLRRSSQCLERVKEACQNCEDIDKELKLLLHGFTPAQVEAGKRVYYGVPYDVRNKCKELIDRQNEATKKREDVWMEYREVSDRWMRAVCDLCGSYRACFEKTKG